MALEQLLKAIDNIGVDEHADQRPSPDMSSGPPVRRPMSSCICSRLTVKPSGHGPGSQGGKSRSRSKARFRFAFPSRFRVPAEYAKTGVSALMGII